MKDPEYIEAFEKLKVLISSDPILKFPNYEKEFAVTTDASDNAIRAVLSQEGHPVCSFSRTLRKHERNYSVIDKEFLAIGFAVNYFRPYLYSWKFKILTDYAPIKYLNTKYKGTEFSKRNPRGILKQQEFNFNVEYLHGQYNKVADLLSRIPDSPQISEDNNSKSYMDLSITRHSVGEQLLDHIGIKEEIINKYKTQINLKYNPTEEI